MFNLWDRHNYRNSWSLQFEHLIIINDTLVIKIIIIFCICLSLSGLTMSMWSPTTETILQSIFLTSDTGPHHLRSSLRSLRVSCLFFHFQSPSFPGKIVWPPSPGPAPLPNWSSFTQSRQVCFQTLGSTMWLRLARGRYIHFGFIWINLQSLHVLDTLWCSIWFKQPNVKSAMCMFFLFGLHSCTLFFPQGVRDPMAAIPSSQQWHGEPGHLAGAGPGDFLVSWRWLSGTILNIWEQSNIDFLIYSNGILYFNLIPIQ